MIKSLFKKCKKSDEIESESSFLPIEMKDYNKYIIVKNISEKELIEMIEEYSSLYEKEGNIYSITVKNINGKQQILKCSGNISFYNYHNLVMWLEKHNSIGVMIHNTKQELSYYFYADRNNRLMDTLIGCFNSKRSLSIYCPESFCEEGNLMIGNINSERISLDRYIEDGSIELAGNYQLLGDFEF